MGRTLIVCLWSWGGASRHHDYLMTDGSIQCFKDTEAESLRLPKGIDFAAIKQRAMDLYLKAA